MFQKLSLALVIFFGFGACSQSVSAQRTVFRAMLPGIGHATHDRSGNPVIRLNAGMCRRRPDLCEFFHAHEMAHHQLGHLNSNISVRQAEAEADRWAASRVSPQAVRAAQQFFGRGRGGSFQHGTSRDRFARVSGGGASQYYQTTGYSTPTRLSGGSRLRYGGGTSLGMRRNTTFRSRSLSAARSLPRYRTTQTFFGVR